MRDMSIKPPRQLFLKPNQLLQLLISLYGLDESGDWMVFTLQIHLLKNIKDRVQYLTQNYVSDKLEKIWLSTVLVKCIKVNLPDMKLIQNQPRKQKKSNIDMETGKFFIWGTPNSKIVKWYFTKCSISRAFLSLETVQNKQNLYQQHCF